MLLCPWGTTERPRASAKICRPKTSWVGRPATFRNSTGRLRAPRAGYFRCRRATRHEPGESPMEIVPRKAGVRWRDRLKVAVILLSLSLLGLISLLLVRTFALTSRQVRAEPVAPPAIDVGGALRRLA